VLIIPVGCNASLVSTLPEFPIGLSLVYDKETLYWPSTTHTWVDTYNVIRWNATDNTSVIIDNGYLRGYPWENNTMEVSLPSWHYEFFSDEDNFTISSWMDPLWIDVTNWTMGENISIPVISEYSHYYEIQGQESVAIDKGSIRCWVARTEYVGANDWDYSRTLRYDVQYGILIKVNSVRHPPPDDMGNYATHEAILRSSNIMNQLSEPLSGPFQLSLSIILIIGIACEIVVIIYLAEKRLSKNH
jgi:hypothetical protein